LVQSLQDEAGAVREASAWTLGKIGRPAQSAVPELNRLTQDENESLRTAAKEALEKIGPPTNAATAGNLKR
jgi:HEAT repeat protein